MSEHSSSLLYLKFVLQALIEWTTRRRSRIAKRWLPAGAMGVTVSALVWRFTVFSVLDNMFVVCCIRLLHNLPHNSAPSDWHGQPAAWYAAPQWRPRYDRRTFFRYISAPFCWLANGRYSRSFGGDRSVARAGHACGTDRTGWWSISQNFRLEQFS